MPFLKCGTHGRQPETFVCTHIAKSVATGEAVGFAYDKVDGTYEALCSACNEMDPADFAKAAPDLITPLCYGCFRDAAALNGIVLD